MAELLDPTITYLILLLGLIGASAGIGILIADAAASTVVIAIILIIIGFVSGMYIGDSGGEWIGFLIVMSGATAVISYFLPIQIVEGIAGFLVGYVIGMRTKRREI